MVKAVFEDRNGRTRLVLGIARENVNRMIEGKPIMVDPAEMNVIVDGPIMIYFGETIEDLRAEIAEFIGPTTKVHTDPRL